MNGRHSSSISIFNHFKAGLGIVRIRRGRVGRGH